MTTTVPSPNTFTTLDYEYKQDGVRDARSGAPLRHTHFWYMYGYLLKDKWDTKTISTDDLYLVAMLSDPRTVPGLIRRNIL